MTKVFEQTGIVVKASNEGRKISLLLKGGGMFTVRSPYPLQDNRAGVKPNVYYTRCGEFFLKEDGHIIDQHGGILQIEALWGSTDAIVPKSRFNWGYSYFPTYYKKPMSVNDLSVSHSGQIMYPTITWSDYLNSYDKYSFCPVGSIKLAAGLEEPQQAQLITGASLNNCWTGETLKFNNWIKPSFEMGRIEKLLAPAEYDTTRTQYNTNSWNLSLWACCREDEDNRVANGLAVALPFAEADLAAAYGGNMKSNNP